jgi:hypothetical protein
MNQLQELVQQKLRAKSYHGEKRANLMAASNFLKVVLEQERSHLSKEQAKSELLHHLGNVGDENLINLAKQM